MQPKIRAQGRPKRVGLRDVAHAARVSVGTASHALSGGQNVRPETRQRILAAAEQLNYIPDRNAARLLHGRTECIGVVFTRLVPNTFYSVIVEGITRTLEEHGYTMRLLRSDDLAEALHTAGHRLPLSKQDVDGLITLNWLKPALIRRLRSIGVPVVAGDASGAYTDIPTVDNDDRGGAILAVNHLLEWGHRRIALISTGLDHPYSQATFAGYTEAFAQHNAVPTPTLFRQISWGIQESYAAVRDLLTLRPGPTAIFAAGDELAVGALQAIREAGLSVPDDISIVGRDDIPLAAATRPALTTVRVDMAMLGRRVTELLLQAIDDPQVEPAHVMLPPELVVRDSSAPLGEH